MTVSIVPVNGDMACVEIPIPGPLRSVNCYAARGPDGWTLVDAGMHDETAETAWWSAFRQLGFGPGDVERIVVTHLHPDHYGAAGWLQGITGAPVIMLDIEVDNLSRVFHLDPAVGAMDPGYMEQHGVPADIVASIRAHQVCVRTPRVEPHPTVTTVREGDRVSVGASSFEVIWAPGHSDGLMVLWSPEDALLIADDLVLNRITPTIPFSPRLLLDPLGNYLHSLQKVAHLPARLALTGHGRPIAQLEQRCAEIAVHHLERLRLAKTLAGKGDSAWSVAQGLFGDRARTSASFAIPETIAHLEYLAIRGELQRIPGLPVQYRS